MKKIKKKNLILTIYALLLIGILVLSYLSFLYGARLMREDFAVSTNKLQAELALVQVEQYQVLINAIEYDCLDVAKIRLSMMIDKKLTQLSEYIHSETKSGEVISQVVKERNPALFEDLSTSIRSRKKSYLIPPCKKLEPGE